MYLVGILIVYYSAQVKLARNWLLTIALGGVSLEVQLGDKVVRVLSSLTFRDKRGTVYT